MLSFLALVVSFLLGGVLLLPVLLASLFAILFYTSPIVDLTHKTGVPFRPLSTSEDDAEPIKLYRAGWLTVRRTYEPLVNEGTYVGMMVSGYRSFMDNRSRDPRRQKAKDQFYGVLKQNVLFLFDNEEQLDCWAAIEVTAHVVGIYPSEGTLDGELFVKRNAICLRPKAVEGNSALAAHQANEETTHDMQASKPMLWFLFVKVNSDKEDWYHSLVMASKLAGGSATSNPVLAKDRSMFEPDDMARLIEGIDQQPDSIPVRWLNALLGRIFLSVYRTETIEAGIMAKIVKKLKRVKTPSILSEVQVREVNVGSAVPFFSKPMLKELTPDGDASMEVHVSYVGDFRVTIETVATIPLGSHFKPYSVRLVLAVVLKEIEGTLLVKVKRPPSNRVWFGFTTMPRMVLRVEPVVSERQIKWSMITSPIEARIREVVLESIVVPHMDDLPFFNSSDFLHRGGIWGDALRKPHDLSTPTGGSGDEAHAIGKDEPVDDEEVSGTAVSTGREELGKNGASLARRRRSSDGDRNPLAFSGEAGSAGASTKSAASGSTTASSLSSFSLSSWRESRGKERENGTATPGEKRKSWFAPKTGSGASTPPSRSEDRTSGEEADLSASRLRDILKKRARSRERERAAAGGLERVPSAQSLSALSLTAPRGSALEGVPVEGSRSTPVLGLDNASDRSVRIDYDSDSTTPLIAASGTPLTDSPMASVVELFLEPATPVEPVAHSAPSDSLHTVASSPPTPQPTSTLPPPLSSRPSFTKFTPSPPPHRPNHQASQSVDAGTTFASAATTASLLASWRTKAADKQAIAAGVAQAKDTMKRWGANWNARRTAEGEAEAPPANGSPRQDFGSSAPSERREEGEGESYREYRAGKERGGEYYPSSPSAEPSDPIAMAEETTPPKHRRGDSASVRRTSASISPSGHFSPAAPLATTKLSTASVSTTPVVSSTYRPATMMAIPGIREEKKRIEVAGDHVSAEEVAKSVEERPPVPARDVPPLSSSVKPTALVPSSTTPLPSLPATLATNGVPPTLPPRQAPSTAPAPSLPLPTTLSNPAPLPSLPARAAIPTSSSSRRVPPPPVDFEPSKLVAFQRPAPPPPVPSRPSVAETARPPPSVPARPAATVVEPAVGTAFAGEDETGAGNGAGEVKDGDELVDVADEAGWGLDEEIEEVIGKAEGDSLTTTTTT